MNTIVNNKLQASHFSPSNMTLFSSLGFKVQDLGLGFRVRAVGLNSALLLAQT